MKRVTLTDMKASVFDLDEAKQRSGAGKVVEGAKHSPIKRGGSDRHGWITTTTHYKTVFPGNVRTEGVIELGIPKETLKKLAGRARKKENHGKSVSFRGNYKVNEIPCFGILTVNFNSGTAPRFVYAEKRPKK
ncbi:hypothetical protein A3C18_03265 [Candidatus Kaiserbacteria bacterium RIFCSPHIGHO2_02_FULL_54_11b]|uniref:Uncharacterized protein n=2 Tax=Candidatus Kaiseribacteriota TaxID=1752734 RepID=A0A1F6CQ11_9BACT|nr:MAG: hypothetical protein A2704_02135 [Candidatus Kaiserbacteria bacterium RIFCSPHIGHO2_01_FULL_54_36b]OGG64491.1 MAG: hypothetical protein A3C18_03265 [Candidatus Kaiserbacteria bacterium RIFCSPHIGHO2_02_FULL_54_11b]